MILKCFLQFTCINLDGSQKTGGNFLNLFQKEGGTQKGGGSSKKRGGGEGQVQPWRKLCVCLLLILFKPFFLHQYKNITHQNCFVCPRIFNFSYRKCFNFSYRKCFNFSYRKRLSSNYFFIFKLSLYCYHFSLVAMH